MAKFKSQTKRNAKFVGGQKPVTVTGPDAPTPTTDELVAEIESKIEDLPEDAEHNTAEAEAILDTQGATAEFEAGDQETEATVADVPDDVLTEAIADTSTEAVVEEPTEAVATKEPSTEVAVVEPEVLKPVSKKTALNWTRGAINKENVLMPTHFIKNGLPDETIITVRSANNPKTRHAQLRFAKYRTGMTVKEYTDVCVKAGLNTAKGAKQDIAWDLNHGFISIELPAPKAVTAEDGGSQIAV